MTNTIRILALTGLGACALSACDDTGGGAVAEAGPVSGVEGACLAATVDAAGVGGLTVLRTEESEAATAVYIDVPGAEAPWLCLASSDGTVQEVRYTGSEGSL